MFFSWQGISVQGLRSSSPLLGPRSGPKELRTTDLSTSSPMPLCLSGTWSWVLDGNRPWQRGQTERVVSDGQSHLAGGESKKSSLLGVSPIELYRSPHSGGWAKRDRGKAGRLQNCLGPSYSHG